MSAPRPLTNNELLAIGDAPTAVVWCQDCRRDTRGSKGAVREFIHEHKHCRTFVQPVYDRWLKR